MLLTAVSRLALIDLQSRLLAAIPDAGLVVDRAQRLAEAAAILGVPACRTEQNPEGIGGTDPRLHHRVPVCFAKTTFSAVSEPGFRDWAQGGGPVILAGTEAHVCVLQTALGLRAAGLDVAVVADAVASRHRADTQIALERMRGHGVEVVTTEMVLFEWLGRYDRPEFKPVLRMIKGSRIQG